MDASSESWVSSKLGISDLLFAASDRSFGANQFYGPYNSWERTKGWFASGRQEFGSRTVAAFGYRRHTDEYILARNNPSPYENNHIDGSWQASLRRTLPVKSTSVLLARAGIGRRQHSQLQSFRWSALERPRSSCAQSRRGLCGPGPAPGKTPLELIRGRARGVILRRVAVGFRSASGRQLALEGSAEAARQRRLWIQASDLYRSLLLRSDDCRQCEAKA